MPFPRAEWPALLELLNVPRRGTFDGEGMSCTNQRAVCITPCLLAIGCALAQEPPSQRARAEVPPPPAAAPGATTNGAPSDRSRRHVEPNEPTRTHTELQPTGAISAGPTDWCTEAVTPLDAETCYVLPPERTDELLVYLHGIVPPAQNSEQKTNFQKVVANAASRARVAALLPRGLPTPSGTYKRWWGWPSGEGYVAEVTRLVERFENNRKALETLGGSRFKRIYVAGSSAGAYFVTALALRGEYAAHGFGALSGGGGRPGRNFGDRQPTPFYIGYGSYDSVEVHVKGLAQVLRAAGWPVLLRKHPTGHGAREIYLDEAFEFWRTPSPNP